MSQGHNDWSSKGMDTQNDGITSIIINMILLNWNIWSGNINWFIYVDLANQLYLLYKSQYTKIMHLYIIHKSCYSFGGSLAATLFDMSPHSKGIHTNIKNSAISISLFTSSKSTHQSHKGLLTVHQKNNVHLIMRLTDFSFIPNNSFPLPDK